MSLRESLPAILARDARYDVSAYMLVFEALERARRLKLRETLPQKPPPGRKGGTRNLNHVTGAQLCLAAREIAAERFGFLARAVLAEWGLRSTSDLGEIVYALIDAGEFRKTARDSRSDFDDVYDFDVAFDKEFVVPTDALAE